MPRRVLHVLSQRPSLTGSGVTLDAMVREAERAGWEQRVVIGRPVDDPASGVGGLSADLIDAVTFAGDGGAGHSDLSFPVPGMSDVMPYPSTSFSQLTPSQLQDYREAWRHRLTTTIENGFRPDVIHSHHVWMVSSLIKDVEAAAGIPVVTHGHGTGLRQLTLCEHLAPEVLAGCRRNERFLVLHQGHAESYAERLGVDRKRMAIVGAGYRDDIFHARDRSRTGGPSLVYAGKLSLAKGLASLLDAVESLVREYPDLRLHVAGGASGPEADALRSRMNALAPTVVQHGRLNQTELAELMRRCTVFVLASFYEGLPLVLVEARACGCRLVSTKLSGVEQTLVPALGQALETVPLPRLVSVDEPDPRELPAFAARLSTAVGRALTAGALSDEDDVGAGTVESFTWKAVFRRVERVWREVTGSETETESEFRSPKSDL